jgi:Icc-related predicted phosphoesterase
MGNNIKPNKSSLVPKIHKLDMVKFNNPNPKIDNNIRFVCISDTHTMADKILIPEGDVLIFSGDFSFSGQLSEVEKFKSFLCTLPHKYKVVIAGNHDLSFDKEKYHKFSKYHDTEEGFPESIDDFKNSFIEGVDGLFYLENSSVNLLGYKIYGSPYTPTYFNWAFMKSDDELLNIWKEIPDDTDIVITHGPPMYIGDLTAMNINAGSLTLLKELQNRIKPKYHIFGHIHEGYGVYSDGLTTYINCSTMTLEYIPENFPIVFDLPKLI